MRVDKLRKLVENVRHFISAFAAADVNNDVCLSPLGKLMLGDGFSASERAGNRRNAALCNRKKRVDNALTGNKRRFGRKLLFIRPFFSYRPFLHKGNGMNLTLVIFNNRNGVLNGTHSL